MEALRWAAVLALLSATGLSGCTSVPAADGSPPLSSMLTTAKASVVSLQTNDRAVGSGFLIASDLVLTNAHLVTGSPPKVTLSNGQRVESVLIRDDQEADIALLRIPSTTLSPLVMREPPPIVGETVIALGNPFGLGISASRGIVSAEVGAIGKRQRFLTDAAINPGNSGGPLLDRQGRVLGLVSGHGNVGSGIGFVVPVADLTAFITRAGLASDELSTELPAPF